MPASGLHAESGESSPTDRLPAPIPHRADTGFPSIHCQRIGQRATSYRLVRNLLYLSFAVTSTTTCTCCGSSSTIAAPCTAPGRSRVGQSPTQLAHRPTSSTLDGTAGLPTLQPQLNAPPRRRSGQYPPHPCASPPRPRPRTSYQLCHSQTAIFEPGPNPVRPDICILPRTDGSDPLGRSCDGPEPTVDRRGILSAQHQPPRLGTLCSPRVINPVGGVWQYGLPTPPYPPSR